MALKSKKHYKMVDDISACVLGLSLITMSLLYAAADGSEMAVRRDARQELYQQLQYEQIDKIEYNELMDKIENRDFLYDNYASESENTTKNVLTAGVLASGGAALVAGLTSIGATICIAKKEDDEKEIGKV